MKTSLDQDIYGIMVHNTNEGAPQKWIFSNIAFPGQKTDEGYWLCNTFGLKSQASYGDEKSKNLDVISDALCTVQDAHDILLAECDTIQLFLREGRAFPKTVADAIITYINGWGELNKAIQLVGEPREEGMESICSVQKLLEELKDTNKFQEEMQQKYAQLVSATWRFMEDNMLCLENHSDEDIASWTRVLQQNFTAETTDSLRNKLTPFHAVRILRAFDPASSVLDDAEYHAIDIINEHFGMRLKPTQLRFSICNRELDMDFLELIPELDVLITQIENTNTNQHLDGTIPDDIALLNAAIDGTLWSVVNRAFKTPNALEAAAMLGDADAVQNITSNSDALHALGQAEIHAVQRQYELG